MKITIPLKRMSYVKINEYWKILRRFSIQDMYLIVHLYLTKFPDSWAWRTVCNVIKKD